MQRPKHFHATEFGCDTVLTLTYWENYPILEGYCKTHQVSHCRCGWEWGWHKGTETGKPLKVFKTMNKRKKRDLSQLTIKRPRKMKAFVELHGISQNELFIY